MSYFLFGLSFWLVQVQEYMQLNLSCAMHADKTDLYLNQVLNQNSPTVVRIWYLRCLSITIKRASASKPCKKYSFSQSYSNNFPQNHSTASFSSWLDQGDNWSSDWATAPPSARDSHTLRTYFSWEAILSGLRM